MRRERSVRSRASVSAPLSSRLVLPVRGGDGRSAQLRERRPDVGCYYTAAGWYLPSLARGLARRAGCRFQSCGLAYGVTSQFSLESFQSARMTNVPELFVFHSLRSCFHFQQPTVGNVRSCWKYPFQFRQVLCGWMDVAADIGHGKQSQLV